MKSLVEKSSGKVLGFWPSGQDVSVASFDPALHEWVEDAPDDVDVVDVALYTRTAPNSYTKAEKVDPLKALEDAILAKVDVKIEASKLPK